MDERRPPLPVEWEPLRRSVPKVGRNDPCPCGSGKKYKKCCEAKDAARDGDRSPWPGLTLAEVKADPNRTGDPRVFEILEEAEMRAVDPTKLGDELLGAFVTRAGVLKLHEEAARAIDEIAARGAKPGGRDADAHRADLVQWMVKDGAVEGARAALAKLPETHLRYAGAEVSVLAALRDGAALAKLDALLARAPDEPADFIDAGYGLHDAGLRALALAVLRATPIDVLHGEDVRDLRAEADELRTGLGIAKEDPVLDLAILQYDRKYPDAELAETKRLKKEAQAIAERVEASKAALADALRKRAEAESAAEAAARRAAEASAARPAEGDEVDALRRRVELLQGELRDQHRERAELRERLRAAEAEQKRRAAGDDEPASRAPEPQADAEAGEEVPSEKPLRPALFGDAFYGSVHGLDARTVLKAQDVALRFASYDPAVWRQAKKMRDLPDVFTLRVGIHHRLILRRSSDGGVEVRELVTREAFDGVLRGYRR